MEENKVERVFVLGAGVSIHCEYPDINGLLPEICSKLNPNDRDSYLISDFIKYFYPINYPNIEDILTLLAISIEMESESRNIPELRYRRCVQNVNEINRAFLKIICQLFYEKLKNVNGEKAIFKFANCLKPKDIVISFNWDLNLEKALENINKDYMYYLDDNIDDKITILKPHGSINWYIQDEITFMENRRELLPLIKGYDNVSIFKFLRPPNSIKKDIVPFITPPILQKTIYRELEIVWKNIYEVLSSTNEINVLGYSLPKADLIARYVFGMAIRHNNIFNDRQREKRRFLVADPDKNSDKDPNHSVYETYRSLVGEPIQFEKTCFEDLKFNELFK